MDQKTFRTYAGVGAALVALLILGSILFYTHLSAGPFGAVGNARSTTSLPENVSVNTLKPGNGQTALMGDTISIAYTATTPSGQIVDSADETSPLTFTLGTRDVAIGLNLGVADMKVGEERRITVPPLLAEGDTGHANVPTNTILTYDVKLVAIVKPHTTKG